MDQKELMKLEEEIHLRAHLSYENDNARFNFQKRDCALLVIDMQNEFVLPGLTNDWIPNATKQIPRIKELIDFCRSNNIPVIYTAFRDSHRKLDRPQIKSNIPLRQTPPKEGADSSTPKETIVSELEPLDDELVIYKVSYGAFYDTPLETILKNLGKNTVIICGCLTNVCCSTTARQAFERSFRVIFGSDINATDNRDIHEAELKTLKRCFARVLTSKEIIDELSI
jgi:nicotinamidase-related amidase